MKVHEARVLAEEVLRTALPGITVDHVVAREELDNDGEAVLSFQAVYDDRDLSRVPSGHQMLNAHVSLQEALQQGGETRFPLLTFRALSEAGGAAA